MLYDIKISKEKNVLNLLCLPVCVLETINRRAVGLYLWHKEEHWTIEAANKHHWAIA